MELRYNPFRMYSRSN